MMLKGIWKASITTAKVELNAKSLLRKPRLSLEDRADVADDDDDDDDIV